MKHPEYHLTEYVEWVEGITKTKQGGLQKLTRRLTQRMFRTEEAHCPVAALEFMISKRPNALCNTGPLYLQSLQKPKRDIWFSHQAVGVNTILKDITLEAGLQTTQKNFTNHTMRKTVVKKLKKAGVATRDIAAITGHKSEESLRDYDDNDISEHMQLSKIINPTAATASNPSYSHHTSDTSYYNFSQTAYYNPWPPMCALAPYHHQERPVQPKTYQFYNCSVNIGTEKEQKQRKRPMVVYSDSDSD